MADHSILAIYISKEKTQVGTNQYWEAKTKHGLMADEVISGLQKSIRRSMTELACRYAYELYTTSPVLLEKLWSRLLTISVEDVGFGNLDSA